MTTRGSPFSRREIEEFIDPFYGCDPKFDLDNVAKATEGLRYADRELARKHLEYVLRIFWPLVNSYRKVLVSQRGMTTYTALGSIASGDHDLDYLGAGHVLFEDFPGKGKTLLAKVPARILGGTYRRFQGMADNMPSDFTGAYEFDVKDGQLQRRLVRGPAFSDICLCDELNRNTPKTMGAILQAWGEGEVEISGETHRTRQFGIATINPIESEGTYPIPEALLDRFMFKITGERFTGKDFAEIDSRANRFEEISRELRPVCTIDKLHEVRRFFSKNVFISDYLKEKRMGAFAEAINGAHDEHSSLLRPYVAMLKRPIIRSGLWGRGFLHWTGATKALAAIRYRSYVTDADALKVLKLILRHRLIFYEGALKFFQIKLGHKDTNQTVDFFIDELIREAW